MKKVVFIGSLVVLLMFCAIITNAGNSRDLEVINNTGYPIKYFSVNQSGNKEWSENELSVVVKDKENFTTTLEVNGNGCAWNIKVMLAGKNGYSIYKDLDLCKAKVLSLGYDQKTDKLIGKTK
jgi:hypothetical protein